MFRHVKLSGKIVGTMVAVLVVTSAISFWITQHRINQQAQNAFRDKLHQITSMAISAQTWTSDHLDTQKYAESTGLIFHTPSLHPRNPKNQPDDFERQALEAFEKDPSLGEFSERSSVDGKEVMHYAQPVRITEDCLVCHGGPAGTKDPLGYAKEGLQVGDLRGAFAVTASTDQLVSAAKSNFIATFLLSFLTLLVSGIAVYVLVQKHVIEPLAHLNGAARNIGELGDLQQEISVEREDELGELASTFAKMVAYLAEMAAVSEAIAHGDLTVEVKPRSSRDTLGHAFRNMIQGLRSIVSTVRNAASQVASGSNQVAAASEESAKLSMQASSAIDEVTGTMHEMSVNVQNMAKSTQMQASSVSETSVSIEQMVTSIQRVADTAKVLLAISTRSQQEVHNGIGSMEKVTTGLNRIDGSIQASSRIIDVLGQRADDIGKITEVIDDLAEQTNLLALNAAIEAARAGEHGLGFAVVADEVRKLAEKSASSTKEISELIGNIQNEVRRAVDNMEKNGSIVNDGLNSGNDLSQALRKISEVVAEAAKLAQEIGAATTEQSSGSTQIAKATSNLDEITHEISSSAEEQAGGAQTVARAMERMRDMVQTQTSGATELAAASEHMSKMAANLMETMGRFSTDDERRVAKSLDTRQPKKLASRDRDLVAR